MNKKAFKKMARKCVICNIENYDILDVHRIDEGKEYHPRNCVVLCANCHRKNHANQIKILCKRVTTDGTVLFYEENSEEKIILLNRDQ